MVSAVRAKQPDTSGFIERDGVRVYFETYGSGPATILMLPTWSVLDSSHGRFQLADLSRHYRVVTFDPRGNGRSDRPDGRAAYAGTEFAADALAVLDATGTDRAVVVACSLATFWMLRLAAEHPERVVGVVASGTNLPLGPNQDELDMGPFNDPAYWCTHYEEFLRAFFSHIWTEPHSENLIESCVAAGLLTTAETLMNTADSEPMSEDEAIDLIHRTRCPWLVIHGERDAVQPHVRAERLAREAGATLVTLLGAGHCSGNRDPVRFNLLIREFTDALVGRPAVRQTWRRPASRPPSMLMVPGDAADTVLRDLAIVAALRRRRPDLRIEWLADAAMRAVLSEHGEAIHPASAQLPVRFADATDSFSAWRSEVELHLLTFTVLHDLVVDDPMDLVVADRAWGVDHYLHENPELKSFAYAWITDAIGWLPDADADDRRRQLMADASAGMRDQVERYGWVRDDAIYLGDLSDLSEVPLGPGLPSAREWARDRFEFSGPFPARFPRGDVADRVADRLVGLL